MKRIVVGVDSSASARQAVDWALDQASKDDVLVVVNIWSLPAVSGFDMPLPLEEFEDEANRLVTNLVADIDTDEGPTIETLVESGHAGVRLASLSAEADLVVVGSRGYGGFKGMLLGSVSTYLAHHARCPLAIIRHEDNEDE